MRGYAAPLAAIPAVAQFIGFSLVGMTVPVAGGAIRIGIVQSFANAVVSLGARARGRVDFRRGDRKARAHISVQGRHGAGAQARRLLDDADLGRRRPESGARAQPAHHHRGAVRGRISSTWDCPPVMSTPSDKVIPYMVVSALVIIVVSFVLGSIMSAIFGIGTYRTV